MAILTKKKAAEETATTKFAKPVAHDYKVILTPVITEKSMELLSNDNKVTVKVAKSANKYEIKDSFERLYEVKVVDVKVINQDAKKKSRGARYQGKVSGYKKAIIKIADGEAIDLFKE